MEVEIRVTSVFHSRAGRSPADAMRLLATNFPASAFLREADAASLGAELARLGISGGSVNDALTGAAARAHRRPLLSGDARARPIYEALDVDFDLVA
jgi:predicted nucleic acid-binding protein